MLSVSVSNQLVGAQIKNISAVANNSVVESFFVYLIMMYPCLNTFITLATQTVARFRGSTASIFIPI